MSGSSDLFQFLSRAGKAWVRTHGTREGIAVAFSRLLPHLHAQYEGYLVAGGASHDERTVTDVVNAVAKYRAKAGWGPFYTRRRGRAGFVPRDGLGAWPRGPERPHARRDHREPRLDLTRRAIEGLTASGIARPTVSQVIATVREDTGLTLSRCAATDPKREPNGVAAALAGMSVRQATLARGLRRHLPRGRVYALRIDDVAAELFPRSGNTSTIRTHRGRAARMLLAIGAARVGLTIAIVGDVAVIGRQRALPDDLAAFARETPIRRVGSDLMMGTDFDVIEGLSASAAATEMLLAVDALEDAAGEEFDDEIAQELHAIGQGAADDHIPALGGQSLREKIEEYRAVGYDYSPSQADMDAVEVRLRRHCMRLEHYRGVLVVEQHRWLIRDANLCEVLGVEGRGIFESARGTIRGKGPEFDARFVAHMDAMDALRRQAGTGCSLGALYRWCHERGGLAMTPSAERIAAALDSAYHTRDAHKMMPKARRPGRARLTDPTGPTPRARRIGRIVLAHARSIETIPAVESKVNRARPLNIRPYDPDIDGVPLFLRGC